MGDDQGTIGVEQAGVVRFHCSAGDGSAEPYTLFSLGEYGITFADRTGWRQ